MDKKNSELQGFDYPDLDLSDEESERRQEDNVPTGDPTKKTKLDQSIQQTNQVQARFPKPDSKQQPTSTNAFRPPAMFFPPPPPGSGNKQTAWIPPAPIAQKTSYNNQNYHQNQQNYQRSYPNSSNQNSRPHYQKQDNRDKKNTVYVKNIPKSYLTQDKLMTFFKNEGAIKQIKVNQQQQSAVIKFVKDQNASKFLKSNKIIFNRSYIIYGESEYLMASQQQVQDRINDELGNVKKAEQTNLKVLREKVSNQLAENIRAIFFLEKNLVDGKGEEDCQVIREMKDELKQEIQRKFEAKKLLQSENLDDFKPEDYKTNHYNWSLTFIRKSNCGIDRKFLFAELLKYGPIISIDHECISQKPPQVQSNEKDDVPKHYLDYRIKVLFLGIKHAYMMYQAKREEMGLMIEGKQIQKFFDSGKLKTAEIKKMPQTQKLKEVKSAVKDQGKTERLEGHNQANQSEKIEEKVNEQAVSK